MFVSSQSCLFMATTNIDLHIIPARRRNYTHQTILKTLAHVALEVPKLWGAPLPRLQGGLEDEVVEPQHETRGILVQPPVVHSLEAGAGG